MLLPNYLKMEIAFAKLSQLMSDTGILLDQEGCKYWSQELDNRVTKLDKEILSHMPPMTKAINPLINIYKKDGTYKQSVQNWIDSGKSYNIDGTTLYRFEKVIPNLGHAATLVKYLLSLGWKPRNEAEYWTYKCETDRYGKRVKIKDDSGKYIRLSPKLPKGEDYIEELSKINPQFKRIADRVLYAQRRGVINGYLKNVRSDGRIPMILNSCGCNTMRVKHKVVCNVPKPSETKFLGKEMRGLFIAPPGRVLVGADVSGQEACILAHLLNDSTFTNTIIENKYKVHAYYFDKFQDLITNVEDMKTNVYACIYGAGFERLGTKCTASKGSNKVKGELFKKRFMEVTPGLEKATRELKTQFKRYGGIIGLDGRLIRCRKESDILNVYCQGNGAIFSKTWTCKYRYEIEKRGLDSKHIIFYHDSNTEETRKDQAEEVGKIMVDCIKWTGRYFKLNLEMTGDYDVGTNWGEAH